MASREDTPIQDRYTLCDDGTMDTVIACDECGEELRFSDTADYRDPQSGALTESGWTALCMDAEEDHDCASLDPTRQEIIMQPTEECRACAERNERAREIIAYIAGADIGLHPHGVPDELVERHNQAVTEATRSCTCGRTVTR